MDRPTTPGDEDYPRIESAVQPKLSPGFKVEIGRIGHQRKGRSLASVDELKKAEFHGMRSKDSMLEHLQVNSDSGSSVASSVAALRCWQTACECDSSANEPLEEVPTCGSLTWGSDDGAESVGSSSGAASAIRRRAGAPQDK